MGNKDLTKFIILTTQRTGSTHIRRYLDSHPYIECWGELMKKLVYREYKSQFKKYNNKIVHTFLLEKFWSEKEENTLAKGFKLMYNHCKSNMVDLSYLHKNGVKIIHLYRENHLKNYVSDITSTLAKSGKESKIKNGKVVVNTGNLIKRIKKREKRVKHYKKVLQPHVHLELTYESFFVNKRTEVDRILSFLEVERMPMEFYSKKRTPDDLSKVIKNWKQVSRKLKNTEYEYLLK